MKIKFVVGFSAIMFASNIFATKPCQEFIDEVNKNITYFVDDSGICVIDRRTDGLSSNLEKINSYTMHTTYGKIDFIVSESGKIAVIADILALSGQELASFGVGDKIVIEIIDCARDQSCRERVREVIRDLAINEMIGRTFDRVVEHVREAFTSDRDR